MFAQSFGQAHFPFADDFRRVKFFRLNIFQLFFRSFLSAHNAVSIFTDGKSPLIEIHFVRNVNNLLLQLYYLYFYLLTCVTLL